MRNIRKILALLLALFLTAALCGCAASRMDDGLAGTSGSDAVKPADATDFMSYAGPIFPLTLAQAAPALSADREILLDCEPYAEYGAAVTVTDRYTIQNSSGEACTATVLYPFVSSLSNLEALRPQLSVDGAGTETAIYPGAFPGWFGPASPEPEQAEQRWNLRHTESWTKYQTLLSGSYQSDALAPKSLPGQTVYVYSFTASGNTTASAATLAITVDADPEQTTILTYGINGYGLDDATGQPQYSYFTNEHGQSLHLLAVLGQDLSGYAMQGYTDGSCEQGKELDALEGTAAHTEMTLADFLRQTAAAQHHLVGDQDPTLPGSGQRAQRGGDGGIFIPDIGIRQAVAHGGGADKGQEVKGELAEFILQDDPAGGTGELPGQIDLLVGKQPGGIIQPLGAVMVAGNGQHRDVPMSKLGQKPVQQQNCGGRGQGGIVNIPGQRHRLHIMGSAQVKDLL